MTFKEVDACCDEFCNTENLDFDLVISIAEGGLYVGHRISQKIKKPHEYIKIGRYDDIGFIYRLFPNFMHIIPKIIQGLLFIWIKPKMKQGLEIDITGKKILLVDDALHTGKTLAVALEYLKLKKVLSVTTFVISDFARKEIQNFNSVTGHKIFPWSKISPEFPDFRLFRDSILGHTTLSNS